MKIIYPSYGASILGGNNYCPLIVQNNNGIIPQFAGNSGVNEGIDNISIGLSSLTVIKNTPYNNTVFAPSGNNSFFTFNETIYALMAPDSQTDGTILSFDNNFNIIGEIGLPGAPSGVTTDIYFTYLLSAVNGHMRTMDKNLIIATYDVPANNGTSPKILYAVKGFCIYTVGGTVYIFNGKNGIVKTLDITFIAFNIYKDEFIGLSFDSGGFFIAFIKTSGAFTKQYIIDINPNNYSGLSTVGCIYSDDITFYIILYAVDGAYYCNWVSPLFTVLTIFNVPYTGRMQLVNGKIFISAITGFYFINPGVYPIIIKRNTRDPARTVKNMTLDGRLNWRRM